VEKGLDLIVANDVTAPGSGFAVDTNQVTLIDATASAEALPLLPLLEVKEAQLLPALAVPYADLHFRGRIEIDEALENQGKTQRDIAL
jgi:hypothetical protein